MGGPGVGWGAFEFWPGCRRITETYMERFKLLVSSSNPRTHSSPSTTRCPGHRPWRQGTQVPAASVQQMSMAEGLQEGVVSS